MATKRVSVKVNGVDQEREVEPRQLEVVGVDALAGDEGRVLLALEPVADVLLPLGQRGHDVTPCSTGAAEAEPARISWPPCCTALTMLW